MPLLQMPVSTPESFRSSAIPDDPDPPGRRFGDAAAIRSNIFNRVLQSVQGWEPLVNERHSFELQNPHYIGRDRYSKADVKRAILEGRTLARSLVGTWVLKDRQGNVLDQRQMTVARVPYFTDDGSFMHRGNDYTIASQWRLAPGAFVRIKNNSEIEGHVNAIPGKGVSHRYLFDPERNTFYTNLGNSRIPTIDLMRTLGVTDAEMRKAWGAEIFKANQGQQSDRNIDKLYSKFLNVPLGKETPEQRRELLKAHLEKTGVQPEVMQATLGVPVDRINKDVLLRLTSKLLAVQRHEQDPDDRDDLAYQTLWGPEDILAERIGKDYAAMRRQLFWKASWNQNLKHIPAGALTRQLESAFLSSGLGQSGEEVNPLEVLDQQYRVTRMGEGGVASVDAIPDESRNVQSSYLNFVDPIRTPESERIGVDMYLSGFLRKGDDGKIYAPFIDAATGRKVWRTPQDLAGLAVTAQNEMSRPTKRIRAVQGGRIRYLPKKQVDLILPPFEQAFSPLANLVPFKSAMAGQRMAMGSRMLSQALPLVHREAPLVQMRVPGTERGFSEELGRRMGAIFAEEPGRVVDISPDEIKVRGASGRVRSYELYNQMPYNRKTMRHNTPSVQIGDMVQPDQLLAASNYTDAKGVAAPGLNARVGYLSWKGLNFEDAIVVSESFANRALSEHMYQHQRDWEPDDKRGKGAFVSLFAGKYNKAQLERIDERGLVRPGEVVNHGDPLLLAAAPAPTSPRVHRKKQPSFRDQSVTWEHSAPGIVTDVVDTPRGATVVVKSIMPLRVGDKLSGLHGNKGVVSDIVPDDEMVRDEQGLPLEVLLNEHGLNSRGNASQIHEAVLGKIAARRGRPYIVEDFSDIDDLVEFVRTEAKRHGVKREEDLVDPGTGRKLRGVTTGVSHILKLHHQAEAKGQGRSLGAYSSEDAPTKGGGSDSSKRLSGMETAALLAHGALDVIADARLARGQRNDEFWSEFMKGNNPALTQVPFVYEKFVNELKASGINVIPDGPLMHIMAMTNQDVTNAAGNRSIEHGETVRFDGDLQPIKGGLFDVETTGGLAGKRWSKIDLVEPFPSPVMEEPIRRLLDLTEDEFRNVLAGKQELGGKTGPGAIASSLKAINVPDALARTRADVAKRRGASRDIAVRRLEYLKALQRQGLSPADWMLSAAPVLPPAMRPISLLQGTGTPLVADANYLYRELIDANKQLRDMRGRVADTGAEQLGVYDAFKAITGLGAPTHPQLVEKRIRGFLKRITGSRPKFGTMQHRLLSGPVDMVGRAVVIPDPELDMDHIGLPEAKAWDVYKTYLVRRLHREGLPLLQAVNKVTERTPEAREALLAEMEERPVIMSRAPTLHKFGIMAFKPRLAAGDAMRVSPLVVKGFGMDFDGDQANYHVPALESARQQALALMLPSRALLSPADFKTPVHGLTQEYIAGLFNVAGRPRGKAVKYFTNKQAAVQAYRRGEIDADTPIRILS